MSWIIWISNTTLYVLKRCPLSIKYFVRKRLFKYKISLNISLSALDNILKWGMLSLKEINLSVH